MSLHPGQRLVLFPIRHHSAVCATHLETVFRRVQPAQVLIEGPSDFNGRLDELQLQHELPIAILSVVRVQGRRHVSRTVLSEGSAEWKALRLARELGARASFVDLPLADQVQLGGPADTDAWLAEGLPLSSFAAEWDEAFEGSSDPVESFLERFGDLCRRIRAQAGPPPAPELARESFIAGRIREALAEGGGRVLVVVGGVHCGALRERLERSDVQLPGLPGIQVERRLLTLVPHGHPPGTLDPRTPLPPLVAELQTLWAGASAATSSEVLHRLLQLELPGVSFVRSKDGSETWTVAGQPPLTRVIEAAQYGDTLEEAARVRWLERADLLPRDALTVARHLRDAWRMGLGEQGGLLHARLSVALRDVRELSQVQDALGEAAELAEGHQLEGDIARLRQAASR